MSFLDTIQKNLEFFRRYNDEKIIRFQNLISNANIKRAISSIPLLLSVNEKKLPGYIEGDIPYGIAGYTPDQETIKYVRGRFHVSSILLKKEHPFIHMLAVMGSVGTIAYTKESDFDYWVCIDRKSCTPAMLSNFTKKIEAIQKWVMDEIKTEVHLFINDIDSIRRNIFAEDETEAFGSTVGAVLKDEFFRSSIIIAGKVPFWWVIPSFITDKEYAEWIKAVPGELWEKEFIDLGNLYDISKEDFLGAALFQLIKSLGNPFKSIIKIGVLEKYLFGAEDTPLLSQKVKMNILGGKLENHILDSYILMFEEVYSHYESNLEDKKLLKILRQNLYLKINPQLSKYIALKNSQNLPYKVVVMFNYIKKWGWDINEIKNLDNFHNWDFNTIIAFWNQVKKFMLLSYQKIAQQLPTLKIEKKIPESDFKLLSRKIKTHFSTEPNKIDNYITFKDIPHESILYIEPVNKDVTRQEWRLYKRDTSSEDKFETTTLRVDSDMVKLLSWTAINEIFDPQFSRVKIQSGYTRIDPNQVVEILTKMHRLFSLKSVKLKNEYLLQPSFAVGNMVLINFNLENEEQIRSIHHIYKTSWGESFIRSYSSLDDLVMILEQILRDSQHMNRPFDDCCAILSPEPFRKHYKEIETLFRECYEFIITGGNKAKRVIASIKDNYLTVMKSGSRINATLFPDMLMMMTAISISPQKEMDCMFLGEATVIQILKDFYKMRRKNSITILTEEIKGTVIIYCINERGNLFTIIKPAQKSKEAISYLYGFCLSTIGRINTSEIMFKMNTAINIYHATVDKFGNRSYEDLSRWYEETYLLKYKIKPQLKIIVENSDIAKKKYCFVFPNKTRSEFIEVERVSLLVKKLKEKGMGVIPIITDIEFKGDTKSLAEFGSTAYLVEKYRLELLIENSLR